MTTRRDAMAALTVAAASLSTKVAFAATADSKTTPARAAKLERPAKGGDRAPFIPVGEYQTRAVDMGYVEEEWFASGQDDAGRPYKTQVFVRRPRDARRFSGTVLVESLHIHKIAAIYMYCSPYILRSGHAWVCIASQKTALENNVKPVNPARYDTLHIEADPAPAGAPLDLLKVPSRTAPLAVRVPWFAEIERYNKASNIILAQVAAALRDVEAGPLTGYQLRHLLLMGHSQTGSVTTDYILNGHEQYRLAGGKSVFDGYFPAGHTRRAFGPRDVPIIQIVSDGDVADANITTIPGFEGRPYRRSDSDERNDRYRLYELAGVAHMGTRYPPHNNPRNWPGIQPTAHMSSMPHHELFNMGLNHLVRWVRDGATPPRANRLELAPGGQFFAKDEYGNTRGGVRTPQLDVPRATYYPNANPDGGPANIMQGIEVDFDQARMRSLYGSPAVYVERFNRRLDELIRQGWLLSDDAASLRNEAAAQSF